MRNIVFAGFMSILYACSPSSHSTEYSVSGVVRAQFENLGELVKNTIFVA